VARALAFGATLCALLVFAHRLLLLDLDVWVIFAIMSAATIFGVLQGLSRRVGAFEAALDADRSLGLNERLSSAIAFTQPSVKRTQSSTHSSTTWRQRLKKQPQSVTKSYVSSPSNTSLVPMLVEDAAGRAAALDPKKVYPHRLDNATKVLLAAVVALLVFSLMPNLNWLQSAEQRKLATTLAQQAKELDAVSKPILNRKDIEATSDSKKLAGKLQALAQRMKRGRMSKEEALLGVGQLRKDLEKAVGDGKKDDMGSGDVQRLQEALKNEQMQSAEGRKMQQELQKGDVEKAAEQLEKLADKMDSGQMTQQEKQQAANDLKKAAQALRDAGQEDQAKQLEQAARSLQQGGQKAGKQGQGQQPDAQGQNSQNGQKASSKTAKTAQTKVRKAVSSKARTASRDSRVRKADRVLKTAVRTASRVHRVAVRVVRRRCATWPKVCVRAAAVAATARVCRTC
jgi:hypothetical protein